MRHKFPLIMLTAFILVSVHLAQAQQPKKVARIGFLSPVSPSATALWHQAFRQGLRDLGWVEGKNISIEYRYAEGRSDRLPDLAADLVRLKLDIIVVSSGTDALAAKNATRAIPIVMASAGDPVAIGLVESLARPGGNITGLSQIAPELAGKRLELLKEVVPGMSRVGVLRYPDGPFAGIAFKEYESAAPALKIQLQSLEVRGPNPDLEGAFQSAAKGRANALIVVRSPVLNRYPKRIADLAIKNRLPSMYEGSEWVEASGLVSYAASEAENYRRAA
jgi:putative ABC transport system substrate-binding protein